MNYKKSLLLMVVATIFFYGTCAIADGPANLAVTFQDLFPNYRVEFTDKGCLDAPALLSLNLALKYAPQRCEERLRLTVNKLNNECEFKQNSLKIEIDSLSKKLDLDSKLIDRQNQEIKDLKPVLTTGEAIGIGVGAGVVATILITIGAIYGLNSIKTR